MQVSHYKFNKHTDLMSDVIRDVVGISQKHPA